MAVVIDDRLLLDDLAGRAPNPVSDGLANGGFFNTSAFYYRLGRAAFSGSGTGSGWLEAIDKLGVTLLRIQSAATDAEV